MLCKVGRVPTHAWVHGQHDRREDITSVKAQYGVSEQVASCHTAIVGGYVVEGHVPAEDIKRLLRDHPAVTGIAAPGMPMGHPVWRCQGWLLIASTW